MTLQERIIAELKVQPIINPHVEVRKSIDFMKEYARKYPFINGFVLGISGGRIRHLLESLLSSRSKN